MDFILPIPILIEKTLSLSIWLKISVLRRPSTLFRVCSVSVASLLRFFSQHSIRPI
jgi:hypothetical protein